MVLSATFSKPSIDVEERLGRPYKKIKITVENAEGKTGYFMEMFTQKQVFHKHLTVEEIDDFIKKHAGTTFKNLVERTESEEITILANKKGKITKIVKKLEDVAAVKTETGKNYIIPAFRCLFLLF